MAKVEREFVGVPDGEVYPIEFKEGDEVFGELAEVAIRNGWAVDSSSVGPKAPASKDAATAKASV